MGKAMRQPPKRRLGVAVTCTDWRLHRPAVNLCGRLTRLLKVDYLNMCCVPGPDAMLHPDREADWVIVCDWFKLLIHLQDPVVLALVAHERCLANPEPGPEHERDVQMVAKAVKADTGFPGPIVSFLTVHKTDMRWSLKRLGEA
jgi:hypothetical protein